jgi:pteridine reductase
MMERAGNRNALALITGASRRLGREIALALARDGYAIGLHFFHSQQEAMESASEIENLGRRVFLLPADLSKASQVDDLFDRIEHVGLPLKVLVNCAGVMPDEDLLAMEVDSWDQTLALNLRAPWLCSRRAAVLMQHDGGSIINITDAGAHRAWLGYPAYILSKSALESLTRLLARRLAPQIRVNAVAPGLVLPSESLSEEEWQRLVKRLPMGKSGDPSEVSDAVLFLIHHEYITGQTLAVDGGYQLV